MAGWAGHDCVVVHVVTVSRCSPQEVAHAAVHAAKTLSHASVGGAKGYTAQPRPRSLLGRVTKILIQTVTVRASVIRFPPADPSC